MKRFLIFLACICLIGCSNPGTSTPKYLSDSTAIHSGMVLFGQQCASCHQIQQDGLAPALGAITKRQSYDWLHRFVHNPQQMITSGDHDADSLYKHFKTMMPSFPLTDLQIDTILAYLDQEDAPKPPHKLTPGAITDPIPAKIALSGLVGKVTPWLRFPSSSKDGKRPAARITKMDFDPSGALYVNDLRGKLYKIVRDTPRVFLDMAQAFPRFITEPGLATGFGSFAFHPSFQTNGLLYTTHTEAPGFDSADFTYPPPAKTELQWVVDEWKIANVSADSVTGTHRELMRINMVTGAHGVQELIFDPLAKKGTRDYGLLYVGVGDGMSVEAGFPNVPHGRNKIWGAIIRIDPLGHNSRNGKYGIPKDNPFYKDRDTNTVREIFAFGFRNPHRITWTRSGLMLACNVGQTNIESVNLIEPGRDFGWPQREGNFVMNPTGDLNEIFALPADDSIHHFTYPIAEFDHDEGNAICGGYEYQGSKFPALKGKFLFGDIPSGRLFYIDLADVGKKQPAPIHEWKIMIDGVPKTLKEVAEGARVDLHFGRDKAGELYLMTKYDGQVYKLTGTN